ncbi:hypothetical protein SK37_02976 [Citrobacter sp. MGH109]|nr:hypothetical protein SK37_02976 [Citrobacter sp. MGH109]
MNMMISYQELVRTFPNNGCGLLGSINLLYNLQFYLCDGGKFIIVNILSEIIILLCHHFYR